MSTLRFEEARACVLSAVTAARPALGVEDVPLDSAAGRVLATPVTADRDYPPLPRSVRDGFAVRASDLPGSLRVIGEVRAGEIFDGAVRPGEAVEIMTGAPLPPGADAVVMIEHCTVSDGSMSTDRTPQAGEFINGAGVEALAGDIVLPAGRRLGFAEIAMLSTVGRVRVPVFRRPQVGIVATGDEVVEVDQQPLPYQVRNSNARSLAVQVMRAGGCPQLLPLARDNYESTRKLIERGLGYDLLLLSGGVSAGKYDIVERVLTDLGAQFHFDRVLIQPGQPLVFGSARGTFFFGLPGNPASTMVTFELFARAAVQLLGGESDPALPLLSSRLSRPFRHKTGLTRFLPAELSTDGAQVTPVPWRGSSDVPSLVRANAFLVADADRESWNAGDPIRVMLK